jgi:flagellar hook-associated protein 2
VLYVINTADGNTGEDSVTASIGGDGRSIVLSGAHLGDHGVTVEMLNGSRAAADLGLLGPASGGQVNGRPLIGDLSIESHRELGTVVMKDRAGTVSQVDLSSAKSVSELLDLINAAPASITARVNAEGNGIELKDASGSSASNLMFVASDGTASSLGIDTGVSGVAAASTNGSDLDARVLSEQTRLADMNGGQGVAKGQFRITNRTGASAIVDLTQDDDVTLGDVISEINTRGIGVTASINETGDGILLTDSTSGGGRLKVEEVGSGTTAKDLNILGQAPVSTPGRLDGSYEVSIDVSSAHGLDDVAALINASGAHVHASVINDGTSYSPYRLNIVSDRSGSKGRVLLDPGDTALRFTTVQTGQDAVIRLGSGDAGANPVVLTSSTNSFDNVINGLSLTVVAPSRTGVTVSVSRDTSGITANVKKFVDAFNTVRSQICAYQSFNPDTLERGVLLGDSTLQQIETSLNTFVMHQQGGLNGTISMLLQLGVTFDTDGTLLFDDQAFADQLSANASSVKSFFTTKDKGFADRINTLVNGLTDPYQSVLTATLTGLDDRITLFNDRVDRMNAMLAVKQQQLVDQFTQMEIVLGQLQNQSNALSAFQSLTFT